MKPEIKARWVAALRSGEYQQGQGWLKMKEANGGPVRHCCLGVLCELAVQDGVIEASTPLGGEVTIFTTEFIFDNKDKTLPHSVMGWAGLNDVDPFVYLGPSASESSLAELNDSGHDFNEIAYLIEDFLAYEIWEREQAELEHEETHP